MPQPTKIPRAFAASGDKNTIPDSTGSIGLASWTEGFPAITSTPFAQGGVAPKRADFNGIFNALSAATVWQQQGGIYTYDNATNYEIGNLVVYSNELYICISANGPGTSVKAPTNTTAWTKVATAVTLGGYIPTTGGNISGAITQTNSSTATLRFTDTTGRVTLGGGTAYNTGAFLWLYGKDNSGGSFDLDANDGNTYSRLHGGADGTFWWGTPSNYKNIAMREDGVLANMFFSQTSGSYTAPYTGIYRITLKGGGGGGGGGKIGNANVASVGAGGGEGAEMIFYERLVKNTSYSYVIGAGGAAGSNASSIGDITPGASGGKTSIVTNGNTFSVSGGGGGFKATSSQVGGAGGNSFASVGTVYKIPGNPGGPGWTGVGGQGGNGGGSGGARSLANSTQHGIFGGGGMGAPFDASVSPGDGGDGYILIEYAG